MTTPQITIVGGGSTHWTPKLLVDLANSDVLSGSSVKLMDIDADSLPVMVELAEHIARVRGIGMSVEATTDLGPALDGAEFVITALSVGGFASMAHDLEIPARYGIRMPVGDTVGPGGIFRALRSAPIIVDVACSMERYCPDALLVNVSNPLTVLTRAACRETHISAVGLCNELVGLKFSLSLLFDVPLDAIDPVVAGVNHLPLVTGLRIGEDDGFAMLHAMLEDLGTRGEEPIWMAPVEGMHWQQQSIRPSWTKSDVIWNNRLKFEIFERFGVLPGASDTHVAEFLPWFLAPTTDFGRDWGVHHYGLAGHLADKVDDDRELAALLAVDEISSWPTGELVADLLAGVVSGRKVDLPMNLPNRGQVDNVDEGLVVETIGSTGPSGVHARDRARLHSALAEVLRRITASQELTVEAAMSGDRTVALEAMLTDQVAGQLPYAQIVALTDELLDATAAWLPRFSTS
ncbi:MAG: family 4 glycosyl hydrolase [Acidimicrobiales bacterium]